MRIYYLEIYVPRRKTTKLTFPATNWIVYFRKYRYLTLIIKYIIIIFSQSDLKGILNLFPPHQQRQESFNTKGGQWALKTNSRTRIYYGMTVVFFKWSLAATDVDAR